MNMGITEVNESLEFTSNQLTVGELYSRAVLAGFFRIPAQGSINTGVFRPDKSRFKSIWLFVTEEKSPGMTAFEDRLEGDILRWQGQSEQGTDHLIINHKSLGLEILLFYRKQKREFDHAGFIYQGVFDYSSHDPDTKPTNFVLTRDLTTLNSVILPEGDVDSGSLASLIQNAKISSLYLLLYLLHLLRLHGPCALYYVPLHLISANIFSNAFIADRSSELLFEEDPMLLSVISLMASRSIVDDIKLKDLFERDARQQGCKPAAEIAKSVLKQFQEEANLRLSWHETRKVFENGTLPFILSETGMFLQTHPSWITYFENNSRVIIDALVSQMCLLAGLDPRAKMAALEFFCALDCDDFLYDGEPNPACGSTNGESEESAIANGGYTQEVESITTKLRRPTSRPQDDSDITYAERDNEASDESRLNEELLGAISSYLKSQREIDGRVDDANEESDEESDPEETVLESNVGNSGDSAEIDTSEMSLEEVTQPVQVNQDFSSPATIISESPSTSSSVESIEPNLSRGSLLERLEHRSRFSILQIEFGTIPLVQQIYFFCLIETYEKMNGQPGIVPLSALTESVYVFVWLLVMKGYQIGTSVLTDGLEDFAPKPKANWQLYNGSFVASLARAVRKNLENEHVQNISDLANAFDANFTEGERFARINSSFVSIEQNWLPFEDAEKERLKVWIATHLCVSLERLNPTKYAIAKAIFDLRQELRDAVVENLDKYKADFRSANSPAIDMQVERLPSSRSLPQLSNSSSAGSQPSEIPSINDDSVDDKLTVVKDARYVDVDTSVLLNLLKNTTSGYKYLVLNAILALLFRDDSEETVFSFNTLLVEMLVVGAKIVSLNSNVSFGSQDRLLEQLAKLGVRQSKFATGWNSYKEVAVRNAALSKQDDLNQDFLRYAPFLLIRPFLEDLIPDGSSGDHLNSMIADLSMKHFASRILLYKIDRDAKVIAIHKEWAIYLKNNMSTVQSWANDEFSTFLIKRNSHLREIDFGTMGNDESEIDGMASAENPNLEDYESSRVENVSFNSIVAEASVKGLAPQAELAYVDALSRERQLSIDLPGTQNVQLSIEISTPGFLPSVSCDLTGAGVAEPTAGIDRNPYEGSNFCDIDPTEGSGTIYSAFSVILEKLITLPTPASLCELLLSDSDYRWLRDWIRQLDLATATRFLLDQRFTRLSNYSDYTHQQALGCMLMTVCSELNRREGQEGAVWPLLRSMLDPQLDAIVQSTRFEGAASPYITDAFRAALRSLNLRNVLDADDHSRYLISIFLQFGFTRYGIRHLPMWLSRQSCTETIRQLTSDTSANRSAGFCKLLESCHHFYQRRIQEIELRSTLEESTWVLPDWHDDIARVLANPQIRLSLPIPGMGRILSHNEIPVIAGKLLWDPPSAPKFALHFEYERLGLTDSQAYDVKVNSDLYGLSQSPDLSWRLSGSVRAPIESNEVSVEVIAKDRTVVFSELVTLWEQEDVQVFDLSTGKRVNDRARLKTERAYAVLASTDLTPTPLPSVRSSFPLIGRNLYLLTPGWPSDFRILIDDEVLWSAETDSVGTTLPFQLKSITPFIERKKLSAGEPLKIAFRGETESTRVEALRIDGVSVPVRWNGLRTETVDSVNLGASAVLGTVDLTVKIRHQNRLIPTRKKLNVELYGCAVLNGVSWDTVPSDSELTLEECKGNQYSFNYKALENGDWSDYGLFESDTLRHRTLNSKKMHLDKLSGNGGPLQIRKIFNGGT